MAGRSLGGVLLCDMDLPDTHILQFNRDIGRGMESGHDPANYGKQGLSEAT